MSLATPTPTPTRRSAARRPPRLRPPNLRAEHKRATHAQRLQQFSPRALAELPLVLTPPPGPTPPRPLPPIAKTHFRSWYQPRAPHTIRQYLATLKSARPAAPPGLLLALYLVDLTPLRAVLLPLTMTLSARGEIPFDPLSLLVVCLWKIAEGLTWATVATRLADPTRGAPWRMLGGFRYGDTPRESTLRAFRTRLPRCLANYLLHSFLHTLHQQGLLPDPTPTHGYVIVGDGQRHRARSAHRCHHAVTTCYQPHTAAQPRPCPAQEKSQGQYFCACDTPACQDRCGLAPRLDREATYSVYSRDKARPATTGAARAPTPPTAPAPKPAPDGVEGLFGYRSVAARLVDPTLHVAWNVHTDVLTATADEGAFFPQHLAATCAALPQAALGYAIYDAATSEQPCLDAAYDLGGIPLFALKHDPSDDDAAKQKARGYDRNGQPLCHQGFRLTWQGLDRNHQPPRARWVCLQACRRAPTGPVADCPYLTTKRGQHVYVQRTLPGGHYRLARLIPPGSRRWQALMGWRNTAEGRNSAQEQKGLKRLPDYGLAHATFLIGMADVIDNLCTLTRLVLQAALLDDHFQAAPPLPRPPPLPVVGGAVVGGPEAEAPGAPPPQN